MRTCQMQKCGWKSVDVDVDVRSWTDRPGEVVVARQLLATAAAAAASAAAADGCAAPSDWPLGQAAFLAGVDS